MAPDRSTDAGLRIFLNYRRDDSADAAGRLHDGLAARFGEAQVFMDIDNIPIGVDFYEVVKEAVDSADIVLAVIGRRWLDMRDASGARRIDNQDDPVRMELEVALQRHARVVPVLVQGVEMPTSADLPDPLKPLARRNAHEMSHARWSYDLRRLITQLEELERAKTQPAAVSEPPLAERDAPAEPVKPAETPPAEEARVPLEPPVEEAAAQSGTSEEKPTVAPDPRARRDARPAPVPAESPPPEKRAAAPVGRRAPSRTRPSRRLVAAIALAACIAAVIAGVVLLAGKGGESSDEPDVSPAERRLRSYIPPDVKNCNSNRPAFTGVVASVTCFEAPGDGPAIVSYDLYGDAAIFRSRSAWSQTTDVNDEPYPPGRCDGTDARAKDYSMGDVRLFCSVDSLSGDYQFEFADSKLLVTGSMDAGGITYTDREGRRTVYETFLRVRPRR